MDALPADERQRRRRRRLRTIPRAYGVCAALWLTAPVLLPLIIVVDLVRRRRFAATRVFLFGIVYFTVECALLPGLLVSWLRLRRDGDALMAITARQQRRFAGTLMAAIERLFSLQLVVRGDEKVAGGPVIVLVRHASIIDTLLPTTYLTTRHGMLLRFVLKRELVEDPCIDIAGHRLKNHFVRRGVDDNGADLDAIRVLASDLGPSDGVLLYPEGTRFTLAKQARAREALAGRSDGATDRTNNALALQAVLPPKPGGTLAALSGAPTADVVVVAHTGLEGFALVSDIWRGGMIGATVEVEVWRIPRATIPTDPEAQRDWLLSVWSDVDRWVLDHRQPRPTTTTTTTAGSSQG